MNKRYQKWNDRPGLPVRLALQAGLLSINEARRLMGLPRLPAGEQKSPPRQG